LDKGDVEIAARSRQRERETDRHPKTCRVSGASPAVKTQERTKSRGRTLRTTRRTKGGDQDYRSGARKKKTLIQKRTLAKKENYRNKAVSAGLSGAEGGVSGIRPGFFFMPGRT